MTDSKDNLEFRLAELLDGRLDAAQSDELRRRIQGDPSLRRDLEQYSRLEEMLQSLAHEDALDNVDYDAQRHQIMAQLERKALLAPASGPRVIRLVFSGLAAAAACVAIAWGAWVYFHTAPAQTNSQTVVATLHPAGSAASAGGQVVASVVAVSGEQVRQGEVICQYRRISDDQIPLAALDTLHAAPAAETATAKANLPPGAVMVFGSGQPAPSSNSDLLAF